MFFELFHCPVDGGGNVDEGNKNASSKSGSEKANESPGFVSLKRGFALLPEEKRREIASKGGKATQSRKAKQDESEKDSPNSSK
jgi:hypothetical protein